MTTRLITSPFTKYFFYKRFLLPNFSSNELDSLSNFIKNSHLITLERSRWWCRTKIIGGCAFEYYPKSRCALISYLIIDEKYRSQGLSSNLFKETIHYLKKKDPKIKAILIETKQSNIYARGIFERWGFQFDELDNYIQPALAKYKDPIFDLSLGIYIINKITPTVELIKEWLDEFVEKIKK